MFSQKSIDKFWSKVEKTDSCWNWKGKLDRDGYGRFCSNYKNYRVHRFSSLLAGNNLDGKVVCHKCDNPSCVNPTHLFLGTQEDNMKDMANKGRSVKGRKYNCIHCNKSIGSAPLLMRWHNDKCKLKDIQI